MDSFNNDNISVQYLPQDVETMEAKFKLLNIDKKYQSSTSKSDIKSPYSRENRCLKKKRRIRRKIRLNREPEIPIHIQEEEKLIADIDAKMAALWSKGRYRKVSMMDRKIKPFSFDGHHSLNNGTNNDYNQNRHQTSSRSRTCARQALYDCCDSTVVELAAYLDETLFIPKKMSFMAEMMYT